MHRSLQQRLQTLLPELNRANRDSTFIDRRIGENNPHLSVEEKMAQRFVREKQRSLKKDRGSLWNIDDDEEEDEGGFGGLTHLGRLLDAEGAMDDAFGSDEESGYYGARARRSLIAFSSSEIQAFALALCLSFSFNRSPCWLACF